MPKEIELTQGKVAIVDDEDFERVNQYKWHAHWNGSKWYAARNYKRVDGKWRQMLLHHFVVGRRGSEQYDHVNRDGLDCRKENLRECTAPENSYNKGKSKAGHYSNFVGVSWNIVHKRWLARIQVNGKLAWSKWFSSEIEAARERDKKVRQFHGDFAYINGV